MSEQQLDFAGLEDRRARRLQSLQARADRHNGLVGGRLQRALTVLLWVYLVGPVSALLIRLLFRLRVEGKGELHAARQSLILAAQHYYEPDPVLLHLALLAPEALWRPRLMPVALVGAGFWLRSWPMRLLTWCNGSLALVRGVGADQTGMRRATELLQRPRGATVTILPTGPIGRASAYEVQRGVGCLALECPDVPVLPVAVEGVQHLRLSDLLRGRRPALRYRIGAAIFGRDFSTAEEVSAAIERAWSSP